MSFKVHFFYNNPYTIAPILAQSWSYSFRLLTMLGLGPHGCYETFTFDTINPTMFRVHFFRTTLTQLPQSWPSIGLIAALLGI